MGKNICGDLEDTVAENDYRHTSGSLDSKRHF